MDKQWEKWLAGREEADRQSAEAKREKSACEARQRAQRDRENDRAAAYVQAVKRQAGRG